MANWCEQQRIDWIRETLRVFGFINREHLQRKFGISQPQASKDLTAYQRAHPGTVRYNLTAKRYESSLTPFVKSKPDRVR